VISAKTPPRPSGTLQAASSRMPRRPRCSAALIRRQGLQRIQEPSGAATCPYPCQDGPSRGRWACPGRLHGPCWRCHAACRAGLLTRRAGCRGRVAIGSSPGTNRPGCWGMATRRTRGPRRPRTRSDAATAVLGWASSTARPRTTPLTAPSSAPTTTGTDRDGKAIGPQSLQTRTHSSLGCRALCAQTQRSLISSCPLTSSSGQRPCIAASAIVQVGWSQ
jgi:hypothetical protein